MSNLPGFQKVAKFSELEIDQPFENSMLQLNEHQKCYIFPEDATIINKNGQILEWKNSSDIYLFSIDTTTFQDKNGLQYHLENSSQLYIQNNINVVADWNNTTKFISASTGEIYSEVHFDAPKINISAESSEDILKIPSFFKAGGGGFLIQRLNCILDLKDAVSNLIQDMGTTMDFPFSDTGKIIITSQQKDILVERDVLREVNDVWWFINYFTRENVLQVEVSNE